MELHRGTYKVLVASFCYTRYVCSRTLSFRPLKRDAELLQLVKETHGVSVVVDPLSLPEAAADFLWLWLFLFLLLHVLCLTGHPSVLLALMCVAGLSANYP